MNYGVSPLQVFIWLCVFVGLCTLYCLWPKRRKNCRYVTRKVYDSSEMPDGIYNAFLAITQSYESGQAVEWKVGDAYKEGNAWSVDGWLFANGARDKEIVLIIKWEDR